MIFLILNLLESTSIRPFYGSRSDISQKWSKRNLILHNHRKIGMREKKWRKKHWKWLEASLRCRLMLHIKMLWRTVLNFLSLLTLKLNRFMRSTRTNLGLKNFQRLLVKKLVPIIEPHLWKKILKKLELLKPREIRSKSKRNKKEMSSVLKM